MPTATGVHREGHSADVYLSEVTGNLPGAQPHLDRIMPGQSRSLPVDVAGADASVQLTALILQDGTGLGDPAALKTFFDHRATELEQLRQVADAFRTVLASKRGMAASRTFGSACNRGPTSRNRAARHARPSMHFSKRRRPEAKTMRTARSGRMRTSSPSSTRLPSLMLQRNSRN